MDGSAGPSFHVLGPFEVRLDGHEVPFGGAKQRLVLAALLMQSNARGIA